MTLTMAIKIIRSMGFANAISLLRDRLCKTQSNKFNTLRDFFIGIGLEIGGPSKVFSEVGYWPVYHLAIRIDNVNFREVTTWHGSMTGGNNFVFSAHQPPGRQYIGNAGDLTWIADAAYDFLLSSHMLEHSANPLKVLLEWKRVLKTDGVMVLVLPHKDGTFDHKRPVTTIDHLERDYELGTTESDTSHFDEILQLHDLSRDPSQPSVSAFERWITNNVSNRGAHHHVFTSLSAAKLVNLAGFEIIDIEARRPYDIFIVAKKPEKFVPLKNKIFLEKTAVYITRSPFESDQCGLG